MRWGPCPGHRVPVPETVNRLHAQPRAPVAAAGYSIGITFSQSIDSGILPALNAANASCLWIPNSRALPGMEIFTAKRIITGTFETSCFFFLLQHFYVGNKLLPPSLPEQLLLYDCFVVLQSLCWSLPFHLPI